MKHSIFVTGVMLGLLTSIRADDIDVRIAGPGAIERNPPAIGRPVRARGITTASLGPRETP